MSIASNISTVLGFRTTPNGLTLRPKDLQAKYAGCKKSFGGSNFYYGINDQNVATFKDTGAPLNGTHTDFFDDIVAALTSGNAPSMMVVLGVEPPQKAQPFAFVDEHMDLVEALAAALRDYQAKVKDQTNGEKSLELVIRYASEMNDSSHSGGGPANLYGGMPEAYRPSFQKVRSAFRTVAPDIKFAFSPAIRRDLAEPVLSAYWPGPEFVDIISCTWYIGTEDQFNGASAFFTAYVLHREGAGKPFAIDELGGCATVVVDGKEVGQKNDEYLQRMSDVIGKLGDEGIHFAYTTLFLDSKWGTDATLEWV